jgi:hypothetical protein
MTRINNKTVTNLSTAQPARMRERTGREPCKLPPGPAPSPALREAGEAPVPLRVEAPKRRRCQRRSAKASRLLPGRTNEPNRISGGDELACTVDGPVIAGIFRRAALTWVRRRVGGCSGAHRRGPRRPRSQAGARSGARTGGR